MRRAVLSFRNQKKVAPYRQALLDAGIEPVLVTPERRMESLDGMGLVLTGGTDVDPELYGQQKDPRGDQPDRERDDRELELLSEALSLDLPVLAICRGMQLFNIAHGGGTLLQHMDGHRLENNTTHEVQIAKGTQLAAILGSGASRVNSRHHQSVADVGEGLVISANAADGVIEGLERSDRHFAVAVQWHPEDMVTGVLEQRKLFEAFREALENLASLTPKHP
jgi:putative glutamine amidotransferase